MAGEAAARLPTFVELYQQIERLAPGVRHVWLVEPEAQLIEVFETREGRAVQLTSGVDEDVLELPPFVGTTLDLAQLWAPRKA